MLHPVMFPDVSDKFPGTARGLEGTPLSRPPTLPDYPQQNKSPEPRSHSQSAQPELPHLDVSEPPSASTPCLHHQPQSASHTQHARQTKPGNTQINQREEGGVNYLSLTVKSLVDPLLPGCSNSHREHAPRRTQRGGIVRQRPE